MCSLSKFETYNSRSGGPFGYVLAALLSINMQSYAYKYMCVVSVCSISVININAAIIFSLLYISFAIHTQFRFFPCRMIVCAKLINLKRKIIPECMYCQTKERDNWTVSHLARENNPYLRELRPVVSSMWLKKRTCF